ncbi:MAG: flagellar basal body-associated protein FliL [Pelotomaculum sp. PtaU1.Bin035]|nr:MAG: flagellar basal body-associated protein FliL [Pelotomaculum sp. PtaU1.Bin035]
MPKNNETPQGKGIKKNKPKKKILLILLIILVVLASSAAGWYFFFKNPSGNTGEVKKASEKTSVEEKKAPAKKTVEVESEKLDLGEVVVNLAGNGGGHYLRLKVVIEYPKDKALAKELKDRQHQVMDTLISTLRTKTLADVSSAGSVEELKKSLLQEINKNLKTGDITAIYFTDFLVQ